MVRWVRRFRSFAAVPLACFPNAAVAGVVSVGAAIELVLLASSSRSPLDGDLVRASFLWLLVVWFWFTTGWIAWAVAFAIAGRTGTWSPGRRRAARGLALVAAIAIGFLYGASWDCYLQLGQFASIETVEFVFVRPIPVHEPQLFWLYLTEARRLLIILAAVAIALPLLARATVHSARPDSVVLRKLPQLTWYTLTLLVLGLLLKIDLTYGDRADFGVITNVLRSRINPVYTLIASGLETLQVEHITPCLDLAELSERTPDDWHVPAATPTNRPNVIHLTIEAMRGDVIGLRQQGHEVMPHLNALARAGIQWTKAYAQASHSEYSNLSVAASIYPLRTRLYHRTEPSDPWPRTVMYDLVQPAGYHTAHISSQDESWAGMVPVLVNEHLDLFCDSVHRVAPEHMLDGGRPMDHMTADGGLDRRGVDDQVTADAAIAYLTREAATGRPFYLSLNFQNPHFPYVPTPSTELLFQPTLPASEIGMLWYPTEHLPLVRCAYFNALHESDRQLGRIVDCLRQLGLLEKTIVVVHGDHGQCFNEHSFIGVGAPPIEPAVRVGCVMYAPDRLLARVEDYPFELVDVLPTVLGLMGWPAHPNFQGIDALRADRPPLEQRLVFMHTQTMLAHSDAVILAGRWKYHRNWKTGQGGLYDLATDPDEDHEVSSGRPELADRLRAVLLQWRSRQLAYHHYAVYYRSAYPPRPPRWRYGVVP